MTGVGAVGSRNTGGGYDTHLYGGMGSFAPCRTGQLPVPRQEKGTILCQRLLSGAQDIADIEGIRPPYATFEVRGLVAIMHGAAETGELAICDWYKGRVRSLVY